MQHNIATRAMTHVLQSFQYILDSRTRLRARSTEEIVFADPILHFQDHGLIYSNTINLVQGKSGVHKSRIVEAVCACFLSNDPANPGNYIGFRQGTRKRKKVIYVDSERNERDQFPYAIQQIKKMAGYHIRDQIPNFDFFSLIQVPRAERHAVLQQYLLQELETDPDTETLVVLDVVTDCVENFNDAQGSMQLTDFLNQQISHRNVTFICVIHENPGGGDKARGHLGTELMNKASSVLQIGFEKDATGKDSELIKVSILKNRVQARQQSVYMRFDSYLRALVLAESELIDNLSDSKRTALNEVDLLNFLCQELTVPLTSNELVGRIIKHFKCSKSTVRERLKELHYKGNTQLANANIEGPRLEKNRQGKNELYSIVYPTELATV